MKKYTLIASAVMIVLSIGVLAKAETSPFDGTWNVKITCEETFNAPAYSYKFVAQVKDGKFFGQYGEEDKPGFLRITGQIDADGSSMLDANGLIGKASSKAAVIGQAYNYSIKTQFNGSQGKGSRMQAIRAGQRNCDYIFTKQ